METTNKFEEFEKEITRLIEDIRKDGEKFYTNDNKAAGVRLRKGLKTIKTYVQSVSNATSPKKTK